MYASCTPNIALERHDTARTCECAVSSSPDMRMCVCGHLQCYNIATESAAGVSGGCYCVGTCK
jgi:hypothetical protein